MYIGMEKIKTYLAEHPQKYGYGEINGLVDVLFWDYLEHNGLSNEAVREGLQEAERHMEGLAEKNIDRIFDDMFHLYVEFQRLSFAAGARVGMRLTLELTQA